jgi:hypothetical protein
VHSAIYGLGTIQFTYNPDLNGDVKIWMSADTVTEEDGYVTVTIPGKILESFILDRLREERIAELEHAEYADLKKLLGGRRD